MFKLIIKQLVDKYKHFVLFLLQEKLTLTKSLIKIAFVVLFKVYVYPRQQKDKRFRVQV